MVGSYMRSPITTNTNPNIMLVPLNLLLQNNTNDINIVSNDLYKRGFSFIKLPNDYVSLIDNCLSNAESFFMRDLEHKKSLVEKEYLDIFQ